MRRASIHLGHAFAFPFFDSTSQNAAGKKKLCKVFRLFVLSCDDLRTLRFQKVEFTRALRIEQALPQFAKANVVSTHGLKENIPLLERFLEYLMNAFETLIFSAFDATEELAAARLLPIEGLMLCGFSGFESPYPLLDSAQLRKLRARPLHNDAGVSN